MMNVETAEFYFGSEAESVEAALRVRAFLEQQLTTPLPRLHPFLNLERELGFPLRRISHHDVEVFSASHGVAPDERKFNRVVTVEELVELVTE